MFVNQQQSEPEYWQQSALARDPEQIKALMKIHQGSSESRLQRHPEVSYEEACQQYKYYKSRTHKADQDEPEFEQNLQFREFFLSIKKRYDMQERARRFRHKQKAEIAYLRDFAEQKSDTGIVSLLGKRSRNEVDSNMLEMEARIKNLENLLVQKNQMIEELQQQEPPAKKQRVTEVSQADQSSLLTKQGSGSSLETVTLEKEKILDQEKPEKVVSEQKEEFKSTGPQSVNSKKRQLIVKIDTTIEPSFQYEESFIDKESIEPFDSSKSCNEEADPSCQNELSLAAPSISERASNFVQSKRMQKLLKKIVDQKLEYTNILKNKVIQQINEKEAEIRCDRQLLGNQMSELLQQKITYARLRQQPQQLLAKRNELMKSIEGFEQEILYIEQNYNNTVSYIEEQEQMLQDSEEQLGMMTDKINHNLSELENLKNDQQYTS